METSNEPDERQFVCSACLEVVPESLIHVLPQFNDDVGGYVTAFRCERCWLTSLDETLIRVSKMEHPDEAESLGGFFERYGVFLHEFRRGDPLPVVRGLFERMIGLMQSGAICLSAGPLERASEVEKLKKLAEAAYDAMYEASPHSTRDCFEDARGYFDKAIDAAKRAGLADEVTQLTGRRDHIVQVYNSQFRGIR